MYFLCNFICLHLSFPTAWKDCHLGQYQVNKDGRVVLIVPFQPHIQLALHSIRSCLATIDINCFHGLGHLAVATTVPAGFQCDPVQKFCPWFTRFMIHQDTVGQYCSFIGSTKSLRSNPLWIPPTMHAGIQYSNSDHQRDNVFVLLDHDPSQRQWFPHRSIPTIPRSATGRPSQPFAFQHSIRSSTSVHRQVSPYSRF